MNSDMFVTMDRATVEVSAMLVRHLETTSGSAHDVNALLDDALAAHGLQHDITLAVDRYVAGFGSLIALAWELAEGREDDPWPALRELVLNCGDELRSLAGNAPQGDDP